MEKEKTAIDFAIEKADILWDKFMEYESKYIRDAITEYIEKLKELKATVEREQIKGAHIDGMNNRSTGRPEIHTDVWYNDKYGEA